LDKRLGQHIGDESSAMREFIKNKRITWISAFAGMTNTVKGSAKKLFRMLVAKHHGRERISTFYSAFRYWFSPAKISRLVRDDAVIYLSCHSDHERGIFPDDRVNDGLKILHYSLARAFASKSFVTYCRDGCVGEKFLLGLQV
jgi:hypothetical protein